MSFVGELAVTFRDASAYANLDAWVARFQARPAYQAALERGGTYGFVRKPAGGSGALCVSSSFCAYMTESRRERATSISQMCCDERA